MKNICPPDHFFDPLTNFFSNPDQSFVTFSNFFPKYEHPEYVPPKYEFRVFPLREILQD